MRNLMLIAVGALLLFVFGCTTTPAQERPKILCPACGTELDAIFHKHF